MKIFVAALFLFAYSFTLQAQPKAVRVELEEAFADYQNAFNNANQSLKTVVNGFKRASSANDARQYAMMAVKYANSAKVYTENAEKETNQAGTLVAAGECDKGLPKLEEMSRGFGSAVIDFGAAEEALTAASAEKELDGISKQLAEAVEILQGGVKKLNEAVENMNGAIVDMRGCKAK